MFLIITASPNADGLTAACGKAALDGIESAGGKAEIIDISKERFSPCQVCDDGWGICFKRSKCVIDDALPQLQRKIRKSEGLILVTPVYFGQPSERMKYFLDRFRRCEVFNKKKGSAAFNKPIDMIAAAGGSGNGTATCLAEMEMWCRQVGGIPKERFGITQYNREPVLNVITDAAARLVTGKYFSGLLVHAESMRML